MQPPTGHVTFVFTDIEGSSRLWERFPQAMTAALAEHDHLLRRIFTENEGYVFKTMGDAFCVAFASTPNAARAALAAQLALAEMTWGETGPLRIRVAIHCGEAEHRDGDYFGRTLNRVARLLAAGHGCQTLFSRAAAERISAELPSGASLRDLGERRLKDLAQPERIFQLVAAGLPENFPPLRSLEVLPNNLPAQVTSFIGRAEEMAEVKRLLGTARLLTLTGPGGTGKTRLSLQVAADLLESYPHGVWLVELATISESAQVLDTVATVLEVREETGRPLLDTLTETLRTRRLLLILDNCEHLVAACAELADTLLRRCPDLRIMASSREPLSIAGEYIWPVPSLDVPHFSITRDDDVVLSDVAKLEAVQLFVERAAAVRPGFSLTAENAGIVARIAWRLDGIPLAIELAAARVKLLTPAQILARIDDRFRLLTGGNRAALPRQQTLGALIDWSYDLLSEKERALLRRLVVFVGGRTLEMVEEVCAGDGIEKDEIFDLLGALVDKSLVMIEPDAEGESRYTLLESVWDYAEQKLASAGETNRFRARHLAYFTRLAEVAEPHLVGPEQMEWLDRLALEHFNLRYALRWSVESVDGVADGLRLAAAIGRYNEVRNFLVDGLEQVLELLQKADGDVPEPIRAKAWTVAGRLAWCQDLDADARRYYTTALELHTALGNRAEVAAAHAFLGFVERNEGNNERSREHFELAQKLARETGAARALAGSLSGLSSLAADAGDLAVARTLKEQSLASFRQLGDLWVSGIVAWSTAKVAIQQGDCAAAQNYLRDCIELATGLGNKWAIVYPLEAFADLAMHDGEAIRAAQLYGAAASLRDALGLRHSQNEKAGYERALTGMRRALGDEAFDREWATGRALRLAEAVALATQPTSARELA